MSHAATTWAFALAITPATTKFVLVALADYANKKWLAWPSIAALEQKTSLKRRAILYALADLKTAGFIEPVAGERKGNTNQIPVYELKGCTTCTVTPVERVHEMHGKGAPHAPVRVHHMHTEPSGEPSEPSVHPFNPPQGGNGSSLFPDLPERQKRSRKPTEPSDDFLDFWEEYPRKVAQKAAWNAWQKAKPPFSLVMESLAEHKKTAQWRQGKEHIPYPATWLNQERWDDEL